MTRLTIPLNIEMQALSDEHCSWLSNFDDRYLSNWEKLFRADNEAAMGEASVRRRLQNLGVAVEPNEDLDSSQKAPDFKCISHGVNFFVEVASISIQTAEKTTCVPNDPLFEGVWSPINLAVFNKCVHKVRQVCTADAPVLIAIGTWHWFASRQFDNCHILNMLLTGETKISWGFNPQTGETSSTYLMTNMYPAIFLKPDEDGNPSPAREPISGALLCAFGIPDIEPVAVLNPNASRPFDPAALPQLEYGSVNIDHDQQRLSVDWTNGAELTAALNES